MSNTKKQLFRYYITNTFSGIVEGTNDERVAVTSSECEEFFVVDTHDGTWLQPGNERVEIKEA